MKNSSDNINNFMKIGKFQANSKPRLQITEHKKNNSSPVQRFSKGARPLGVKLIFN